MTTQTKNIFQQERLLSGYGIKTYYERLIKNLEPNHFGLISMSILIGSCIGGLAAMSVFENHGPFWQFIIGLYFSIANLVASIAQAPTKWVLNIFCGSALLNAFLIIIN
jgi:hypothetical protein